MFVILPEPEAYPGSQINFIRPAAAFHFIPDGSDHFHVGLAPVDGKAMAGSQDIDGIPRLDFARGPACPAPAGSGP